MMESIETQPQPQFKLGKSLLFDYNDDDENKTNTVDNNVPSISETSIETDDSQLTQFISSNGSKISLKKKEKAIQTQTNDTTNEQWLGIGSSTEWRQDSTYGINISELLDRIEAHSEDRLSESNAETDTIPDTLEDNQLWVERWRPKKFLDLVGNEKTNRRILKWLRDWSPAVFKEQIGKLPSFGEDNDQQEPDPLMRPRKKILLIHGPPGIGKTSVAHVVCKQAGFQVTEINASDERSGPSVKDKIHNTLFNKTLHSKPVCLVADEIDGSIESGFVKILIDIINNDTKATNKLRYLNNNESGVFKPKSNKKKKKKSSNLLLRPIIAICNNIYAPALDKLKPFCEIVSFKRPSDGALQERLLDICNQEQLQIPVKVVNDLIDLSQGDVRNCINNLQFMATHNKPNITNNNNVNAWESSSKDLSMSWYLLVNRLFKKDAHLEIRTQVKNLLHEVEMNGNYDRILQGCYTLYPSVKYSDRGVQKPSHIADWLYFHDLMAQSLYHHNGELIRYSSVVPLVFFQNFGDIANKEDLKIKNDEYLCRDTKRFNYDIVNSIRTHLGTNSPKIAVFTDKHSLVFEFLPYIDYIISSDLTKMKNLKLKNQIATMLLALFKEYDIELTQIQDDSNDSRSILGITPPIDKIVLLQENRKKELITKRPISYNILSAKYQEERVLKRHISQTIKEKEKIEENKNKKQRTNTNTIEFFKNQYANINSTQADENSNDTNTSSSNYTQANPTAPHEKLRIWVKYKAGFSNAVRKNVSWDGLWH